MSLWERFREREFEQGEKGPGIGPESVLDWSETMVS